MSIKTYVTYYYPGSFMAETSSEKVESRDPASIAVPDNAFAFEFWEREEITVGDETLVGRAKNKSGRFYPGGRVMDIEDVRREEPHKDILISNMEVNGWNPVVKTRMGNYQPLEPDDVVMP